MTLYVYIYVLTNSGAQLIIVPYRKTAGSALDSCQFIGDKICIIAGICWQIRQ